MKVLLEKGVWLADGEGDPPRTLKKENAKEYGTLDDAIGALECARLYRTFKDAVIEDEKIELVSAKDGFIEL